MSKADSPPDITGLRFVRKLGSGGYADVFLYDQATPQRQVAVKVLRETGLSAAAITRFTAEADAMARLEHPYIVPVYATGTALDHRPYIAMMYYPRPSLAERARSERLPVAEALQLGIQLGAAVETAHRAGLLHRDIKPANVLTSAYGRPGLTDFGIAGQLSQADDDDVGVSVPWSPPEILYATAPATVRSDVYSLAATLWHLLVGRSPFEIPGGDNAPFALMRRIRDVAPPSTGRADVPASLDRLLRASMGKDAVLRPASALEFVGALQAIEQELRLTRTPLELANAEHLVLNPRSPGASDRTQVRSPQVLGTTPSLATVEEPLGFAPVDDASVMATRRSNRRIAPVGTFDENVEGRTVLRAPGSAAAPPAPVVPEHVGRGRQALLFGLAVLVLVALGLVVWAVVTAPKPARPDPPITVTESPPDIDQSGAPPGKPEISCRKDGAQVTCAWTYANPLPGDQYLWRESGSTDTNPVITQPQVVVPTKAGRFCLDLKIYRLDGTNPPKDWTKGCTP